MNNEHINTSKVSGENVGESRTPKKKSWPLFILLTVSILPIFAAYFMYYTGLGVPETTVNAGKLLPKAISVSNLIEQEEYESLFKIKKWRMLVPVVSPCGELCQDNLYLTRQVHVRLGEKGLRVGRIAVNLGGEEGEQYLTSLADEHPKLESVSADQNIWQQWVSQSNSELMLNSGNYYLLVDQEGNAMMAYDKTQTGNELLKDIKRALKYSIDYQ